jgi:molybdopterin converting factor small subunit
MNEQVTVRFFAGARAATGCDQVAARPGTLEEVIAGLHVVFPALTTVTPACSFLVDGVSAKPDQGGPRIPAGSSVDVLPPFAGG